MPERQPTVDQLFASLLLRTLLVVLLVALWWHLHLFGRLLGTGSWLGLLLLMAGLIGYGGYRRQRSRRAAFLAAYLEPVSVGHRWLRGGVVMAIWQGLLAVGWAVVLCVGVLRLESTLAWWLLLINLPLLVLLQSVIEQCSRGHIRRHFAPEWSWRVSLWLMLLVLLPAITWSNLYQSYPDFSAVSLESAVWYMMDQDQSRSAWVQTAVQLGAAKDAIRHWLAQQWLVELMPAPATTLAWLLVLADEALLIWPCLLCCQGALIDRWDNNEH